MHTTGTCRFSGSNDISGRISLGMISLLCECLNNERAHFANIVGRRCLDRLPVKCVSVKCHEYPQLGQPILTVVSLALFEKPTYLAGLLSPEALALHYLSGIEPSTGRQASVLGSDRRPPSSVMTLIRLSNHSSPRYFTARSGVYLYLTSSSLRLVLRAENYIWRCLSMHSHIVSRYARYETALNSVMLFDCSPDITDQRQH